MAVVVFLWASYHQYKCHSILADIRSTTTTCSQHPLEKGKPLGSASKTLGVGIPEGDWFRLVSCPHYTAEIIIYGSLLLLQAGSVGTVLPCLFVGIVLSLSARQMHSWYHEKFEDYPKDRKRIIPYIF